MSEKLLWNQGYKKDLIHMELGRKKRKAIRSGPVALGDDSGKKWRCHGGDPLPGVRSLSCLNSARKNFF